MAETQLNEFTHDAELDFQGRGVLTQAISETEAKDELKPYHDLSYGHNDINLYRRL